MLTYVSALVVLALVLAAHIAGIDGLYFAYAWYDIMMHILGGTGIALFLAALFKSYKDGILFEKKTIIIGVLIIGVIWELFEIYYDITGHQIGTLAYYIDTIKDLVDDTIGGSLVAWLITRRSTKI